MNYKKIIYISSLFTFLVFNSCNTKIENTLFYRAINPKTNDTAYLKLTETGNQFTGKYIIKYSDKSLDSGQVSGEIIKDTLKGRYKYVSKRNSKFTKPIVFLKEGKNLKLGNGMVSYYAQIPFYANGTIQFPDSLFSFEPIEKSLTDSFN